MNMGKDRSEEESMGRRIGKDYKGWEKREGEENGRGGTEEEISMGRKVRGE
jgi:hypothetical protein